MKVFKLYWTLSYFSLNSYFLCFNFCICFIILFVPVGITSSAVEIKICAITAEIKNYQSIINKEKKKKHEKIVLLGKIS